MNLYLKEVKEEDINILNEYNHEYEETSGKKGWVEEEKFTDLLRNWKDDLNDDSKIHVYPFWLMENEKVVGLVILKDNLDEEWKKFGGNVSYGILPSFRNKGYGTSVLHLALIELKKLGIKEVIVTCNESNIGSQKVIENNYGKLKDVNIDKNGKQSQRYLINIEESLDLYNK